MLTKTLASKLVLRSALSMDKPLSMNTRKENAPLNIGERVRNKGEMLDQMVATIGWSRANARRALAKRAPVRGRVWLPNAPCESQPMDITP